MQGSYDFKSIVGVEYSSTSFPNLPSNLKEININFMDYK